MWLTSKGLLKILNSTILNPRCLCINRTSVVLWLLVFIQQCCQHSLCSKVPFRVTETTESQVQMLTPSWYAHERDNYIVQTAACWQVYSGTGRACDFTAGQLEDPRSLKLLVMAWAQQVVVTVTWMRSILVSPPTEGLPSKSQKRHKDSDEQCSLCASHRKWIPCLWYSSISQTSSLPLRDCVGFSYWGNNVFIEPIP